MQNKTDEQVYAGFFVRLAAYLLDSLIVGAALLVVRIPFTISSWINPDNIVVRDFIFEYSVADIVLYALRVIYFILLTYYTGATVGKKVLHIQVVSVEDRKMTLFEVIYRETIGRFLAELIVYVGYFMIGAHREKRGLHDLMSDTKVVYCHKKSVQVDTPIVYQNVISHYVPASYVQVPAQEEVAEEVSQITEEIPAELEEATENVEAMPQITEEKRIEELQIEEQQKEDL